MQTIAAEIQMIAAEIQTVTVAVIPKLNQMVGRGAGTLVVDTFVVDTFVAKHTIVAKGTIAEHKLANTIAAVAAVDTTTPEQTPVKILRLVPRWEPAKDSSDSLVDCSPVAGLAKDSCLAANNPPGAAYPHHMVGSLRAFVHKPEIGKESKLKRAQPFPVAPT